MTALSATAVPAIASAECGFSISHSETGQAEGGPIFGATVGLNQRQLSAGQFEALHVGIAGDYYVLI